MKRCMAAVAAVVLAMSLGACKSDGHNAYREIYERYNDMESYSAIAEVTVRNERSENTYVARQVFLAPDWFLNEVIEPKEIAGSGFVFKDGGITLKSGTGHAENVARLPMESVGVLSVNDFFESYYKSEETVVTTYQEGLDGFTILECYLNSKNENRFRQRLWVDNKTFLPARLETYDTENRPVVTVRFREFDRNCKVEKNEF